MALVTINKSRVFASNTASPYVVYKNNDLGVTVANNNSYVKFPLSLTYTSGKYYLELKIDSNTTTNPDIIGIGIRPSTAGIGTNTAVNDLDDIIISDNHSFWNGTKMVSQAVAMTIVSGDVLGLAIDIDNKRITYYHNGVIKFNGTYNGISIPEVFAVAYNTSATSRSFTFVVSKRNFSYYIPEGYIAYDGIGKTKYLIQNNSNVLKTIDGSGNIIDSPSQMLDEANYLTNGFNNPLNDSQINQLKSLGNLSDYKLLMYTDDLEKMTVKVVGDCTSIALNQWFYNNECKLNMWTDDVEKTESKLVYSIDQFDLTQWLKDNECSLKMWTDDITKTKATMEYEVLAPYRPIDILKRNNGGVANVLIKEV